MSEEGQEAQLLARLRQQVSGGTRCWVQGYLAHKKLPPPKFRTLQYAYA